MRNERKVDIKKTNEYYENYHSCNCGDCKSILKLNKLVICDSLRSLGIPYLKLYELMSIYHEKDKKIVF